MSTFKVVRDSAGRCRGCGPNDGSYDPAVPPGGSTEESEVFVPIDPTPEEETLSTRISQDLSEFQEFINDSSIVTLVNQTKAQWISWAGTNFPTLTSAERTRLGTLFWVVSIGVRRAMR